MFSRHRNPLPLLDLRFAPHTPPPTVLRLYPLTRATEESDPKLTITATPIDYKTTHSKFVMIFTGDLVADGVNV